MTAWLKLGLKHSWWILTLLAMLVVVGALLLSTVVPYRPFDVTRYDIDPVVVCPGDEVTAYVTRSYNTQFTSLHLIETWVTVEVPGLRSDRPVVSHDGYLPPPSLKPTDGDQTIHSPLIKEAPDKPGVYKVRISATATGTRWFGISAKSTRTFTSNLVTVRDCEEES